MSKFLIDLDEQLLNEANEIFDLTGVDANIAIKMFLKRVVKEKSIVFLFQEKTGYAETKTQIFSDNKKQIDPFTDSRLVHKKVFENFEENNESVDRGSITKSMAIRLLRGAGHNIVRNVTFASKNRGAYIYWANPEYNLLNEDWNIILNDWIERKIYLFLVPANSIAPVELTPRSDKMYLIDLQIMYHDTTFTDTQRSWIKTRGLLSYENEYLSVKRIDSSNKWIGENKMEKMWSIIFSARKSFINLPTFRQLKQVVNVAVTAVKRGEMVGCYGIRIYGMTRDPNEQIVKAVLDFIFL